MLILFLNKLLIVTQINNTQKQIHLIIVFNQTTQQCILITPSSVSHVVVIVVICNVLVRLSLRFPPYSTIDPVSHPLYIRNHKIQSTINTYTVSIVRSSLLLIIYIYNLIHIIQKYMIEYLYYLTIFSLSCCGCILIVVVVILSLLSCRCCLVVVVLPLLSCRCCLVVFVLSLLSCRRCLVVVVLL